METQEAERLLVPVWTPSQEASLPACFDELDRRVRARDRRRLGREASAKAALARRAWRRANGR
jgi:hypothetical protein